MSRGDRTSPKVGRFGLSVLVATLLVGACSGQGGGTPTTVSLPPPIDTLVFNEVFAACLVEAGFAAEVVDGAVETRYSNDQREAFVSTSSGCEKELTERGIIPPEETLTEPQLRLLYDLFVTQNICLAEAGFDVSEPPSLDAFVSSGGYWTPTAAVPGILTSEQLRQMEEVCPLR